MLGGIAGGVWPLALSAPQQLTPLARGYVGARPRQQQQRRRAAPPPAEHGLCVSRLTADARAAALTTQLSGGAVDLNGGPPNHAGILTYPPVVRVHASLCNSFARDTHDGRLVSEARLLLSVQYVRNSGTEKEGYSMFVVLAVSCAPEGHCSACAA
ncbi:hypothetical protein JKP88DRAFT_24318 [Tribonema minus]|uniref:Uncharacterized protein n=1 Tax=Tribonema minus TaxID=303371 RepID=A0A835Z8F9_9STRA|nr:hypothetical protein JKP88DRAFT_24318 [Tribonema minus]